MNAYISCQNKVRDIINLIRVKQKEELHIEGGTTRIEESTAEELINQLEQLSTLIGKASGGVVESKTKGHKH